MSYTIEQVGIGGAYDRIYFGNSDGFAAICSVFDISKARKYWDDTGSIW